MIPKIIHYIWLGGGKKPKVFDKCYKSWKKYCPDYEIKCWDESNLDLNKYQYAKDAYEDKKYAFASDVFRFDILYNEGGIYLDIDVELLKPIDEFLGEDLFIGFETSGLLAPGLILGGNKENSVLEDFISLYKQLDYQNSRNNNENVCTICSTYFKNIGFKLDNSYQKKANIALYPSEYFCPIDVNTNKKSMTNNTYAIHHYCSSWYTKGHKFLKTGKKVLNKLTFGLAGTFLSKHTKKDMINSDSLISVIVPIYKVEKYLGKCIDSIICQTYENLEIILVNDGSPDGCLQICHDYAKKNQRIKVIDKKNGGLSDARNVGLEMATGEFFCFVDGDDQIHKDYVLNMLECANSNNADLVICDFLRTKEVSEKAKITHKVKLYKGESSLLYSDLKYVGVVAWNKLYRMSTYQRLKYPVGKIYEDFFVAPKIIDSAKTIAYLKDELYYYIQRDDSIMNLTLNKYNLEVKYEALNSRIEYFFNKKNMASAVCDYKCCLYEDLNLAKKQNDNQKLVEIKKRISEFENKYKVNFNCKQRLKMFVYKIGR